jgi:hypothetical protein
MTAFLREVWRRDRLLAAIGWLHVALFVLALGLFFIDSRTVLGINPWIKPMKFMLSIIIYVWTVAWLLGPLQGLKWAKWVISGGVSVAMVTEIVCISMQSARGVGSHFNVTSAFDAQVYSIMGAMIGFNTVLAALLLLLWCVRPPERPRVYVWGVRLGLVVFLFGSGVGGMMVTNNAHAVGVADGGAGLPFVNWSTEGGDLRIAHFLGLHALQVLPLTAYILSRWRGATGAQRGMALTAVTVVYTGAYAALLWIAWSGRPLIAG